MPKREDPEDSSFKWFEWNGVEDKEIPSDPSSGECIYLGFLNWLILTIKYCHVVKVYLRYSEV